MTTIDSRIWWVLGLIAAVLLAYLVVDHVLFPTLPVPAGAPAITR